MHLNPQTSSPCKRFLAPKALAFCTLFQSLLFGQHALSAVIYQDDFNRSNNNTLGSTWSELENQSNDVAIYRNQLRLRDQSGLAQDAVALLELDLSNYQNLNLRFDWRPTPNTETSDTFYVGWNNSNAWQSVWSQSLGNSTYTSVELDLSKLTANPNDRLSFWVDVSSKTETVYVDNFLLEGELIANSAPDPVTAVSEPNASLLLSLGLLGLLFRSAQRLTLKKTSRTFTSLFSRVVFKGRISESC